MTLKELSLLPTPMIVKLLSKNIPEITHWQTPSQFNFDIILIKNILDTKSSSSGRKIYTVQGYVNAPTPYKESMQQFTIYFLEDYDRFEVVQDDSFLGKYEQLLISNLKNHLGFPYNIGSDPEIFIEADNKVIPAFDFLPSKQESKDQIFWDGVQAEFNIEPNTCLAYACDYVQRQLQRTLNHAKKINPTATLSNKTIVDVPYELLLTAKEEHIQFGCTPSFNIYNMKGVEMHGREVPFRSAGGHIHFGIGKQPQLRIERMVKALDAILGVACVSLFAGHDSPKRRSMYGMAGEYRLPAHGLEYRTLSNAWLIHPLLMHLVFDLARKVLVFGDIGLLKYWKATEEETINCINSCDVTKAREIMERNKDLLIEILNSKYFDKKNSTIVYNLFYNGLDSFIANPNDIAGNWKFGMWSTHSEGKNTCFIHSVETIKAGKKVA